MDNYSQKKQYNLYCAPEPMPDINLAEAYIKDQAYIGIFPIQEGFKKGNMFPNLYQPYTHC